MFCMSPDVDLLWPTWIHFLFLWWGFVSLLAYPIRMLLTDLSWIWTTGRGRGVHNSTVKLIGHQINWVYLTCLNCRWSHASFMGTTQYFCQLEDSVWTIYIKIYWEIPPTGGIWGDAGITICFCTNVSWKTTLLFYFVYLVCTFWVLGAINGASLW